MSSLPSLKEMLEAGVHFGHETKRWNPKMAKYIFTAKEKIHIIDLEKTESCLQEAVDFVKSVGEKNGTIVFLATKRQASDIVKAEAERVGAMYMITRWLGGLFTNYESVAKTIAKLPELEASAKDDTYTKREQLLMTRHADKLERYVGGVRHMTTLPDAIFVVDARKEDNAIKEARKVGVPIVAIVDTNSDPTSVDYPIPGNDDAIRSISVLVKAIADAYLEGKEINEKKAASEKKKEEAVQEKAAAKEEIKSEKKAEVKKETKKEPEKKEEVKKATKVAKVKKEAK